MDYEEILGQLAKALPNDPQSAAAAWLAVAVEQIISAKDNDDRDRVIRGIVIQLRNY